MTVPCCPKNPDHHLNNEPDGYYCHECARYYMPAELSEHEVAEEWES